MAEKNWVIYGANGFTAKLTIELAISRGHKPILAGRSAEKLAPLATKYGLEYRAVSLDDAAGLESLLANTHTVLHCAGPFVHTYKQMAQACLKTKTNYLDITGEIPVFLGVYALDKQAKEAGIAMIPGIGFDVVPSDCLAKFASEHLEGATEIEIALNALSQISAGTMKTVLEGLSAGNGGYLKAGKFVPTKLGEFHKRVKFSHREKHIVNVALADIASAPRSTGIINVKTYIALSEKKLRNTRLFAGIAGSILKFGPALKLAQMVAANMAKGPSSEMQADSRSYVWARVSKPDGTSLEATLETIEAYRLTAECGLRAVEKLASYPLSGAFAPAQAFGSGFILELPNTKMLVSE
jgi:short subunit dehydrogenase-like uncharacterized protein